MKILLAILASSLCSALTVTVRGTSPTQAVLSYTAPSGSACTVEVSESNTYSPLVHDVDGSLFTNANQDSRIASLSSGTARVFVVGTRQIQTASDSKNYSRALQQATQLYYRVNCSGTVATGTFTTKTMPFGVTMADLIPLNADGTYNFPSFSTTDRTETLIDPSTGALLKHVSLPGDQGGNSAGDGTGASAGGFGTFSNNVQTANGNWLTAFTDILNGITPNLYATNATTGASTYLGTASFFPANIDPNGASIHGIVQGEVVAWDFTDANTAYTSYTPIANSSSTITVGTGSQTFVMGQYVLNYLSVGRKIGIYCDGGAAAGSSEVGTITSNTNPSTTTIVINVTQTYGAGGSCTSWQFPARSTFAKWVYTGNDVAQTAGTEAPRTVVDMLGSVGGGGGYGLDLGNLAVTFDSRLDLSIYTCGFTFNQSHYMFFHCRAGNQDSGGWLGVYDLGNGLPLASAGNPSGTGTGHVIALAQMYALPGSRWCSQHTDELLGNVPIYSEGVQNLRGDGSGAVTGAGPYLSTLNGAITNVATTLTLASSWTFGGSPPGAWASGQPLSLATPYYLMNYAIGDIIKIDGETIKLTGGSNPTWTVARAQGGTFAASHSNGASVSATCESQGSSLNFSGGYVYWDFVASADGTNTADYQMQFGSHPVSRGNYRSDDAPYQWRSGAATDKSKWGAAPDGTMSAVATFAGQYASGNGNSFQKHPAMPSTGGSSIFDNNYWVGTSLYCISNSSCTTNITGSLYFYDYTTSTNYAQSPQVLIARKHFPTVAKTQGRALQDISGPGSVLTGGSGDNYKYCIAVLANECVSGSAPGAMYFNHPNLQTNAGCSGGENPTVYRDICFGNWWPQGIGASQFKIVNDTTGGTSYRHLTNLFGAFESYATQVKMTYDGGWAFYFGPSFSGLPGNSVYAIKVPADPGSDGVDRSTFVPATLNLTAPGSLGVATARVKFGYPEQGGSFPFDCTSRLEKCNAVASSVNTTTPFYWSSETFSPLSCTSTCTIAVPVYPLHTAYLSVEYLNGGGTVVSTQSGVAIEGTVALLGASGGGSPIGSLISGKIGGNSSVR